MGETLKAVSTVATAVVAVYVAVIGTMQWKTARDKLRLDLYNRRFDIYSRAVDLVNVAVFGVSQNVESKELLSNFGKSVRESRFLFADDPRVFVLLNEIHRRCFSVGQYYLNSKEVMMLFPGHHLTAYNNKQANVDWLMESVSQLDELLRPYLSFDKHLPLDFMESLIDPGDQS